MAQRLHPDSFGGGFNDVEPPPPLDYRLTQRPSAADFSTASQIRAVSYASRKVGRAFSPLAAAC